MNGVCKVQQLKASLLTDEERGAIARLKKDEGRDNEAEVEAANKNTAAQADETPRTRRKRITQEAIKAIDSKRKRLSFVAQDSSDIVSSYQDCRAILGTSDIVERCFSHCKKILTDTRMGMSPSMVECFMFLKMNMDKWDKHDVGKAMQLHHSKNQRNRREEVEDEPATRPGED